MMKITGLSHLFKWENLHNWWLTKYFFAPLYVSTYEEFVTKFTIRFDTIQWCHGSVCFRYGGGGGGGGQWVTQCWKYFCFKP